MRCLSDDLWLLGFVAILGVLALLGMITNNAVILIGQIRSPPRQAGHLVRPRFDKSMAHVIVPARTPNANTGASPNASARVNPNDGGCASADASRLLAVLPDQ